MISKSRSEEDTDWSELRCSIGGLNIDPKSDNMTQPQGNYVHTLLERVSKDPHIISLTQFSDPLEKWLGAFTRTDENGKEVPSDSIEDGFTKPTLIHIKLDKDEFRMTNRFTDTASSEVRIQMDFYVIIDGTLLLIFSKPRGFPYDEFSALDVRDMLLKLLGPFGAEVIVPCLADEKLKVSKTERGIEFIIEGYDKKLNLNSGVKEVGILTAIQRIYSSLCLDLRVLYRTSDIISITVEKSQVLFSALSDLLDHYESLLSSSNIHIFSRMRQMKSLNLEISQTLKKLNQFYVSKSEMNERVSMKSVHNTRSPVEDFLEPIRERVTSRSNDVLEPDLNILGSILGHVRSEINSLRAYYIAIASSLLGAFIGVIVGHMI